MTDGASPQENTDEDLAASLARLERALARIAVSQPASSAPPAASELPDNLAARLDGMIARLRAVIDNGEESAAWPR